MGFHPSTCNHCFNTCKEFCKQGTVWAVPAPGTDTVVLGQKLALLLLAHPNPLVCSPSCILSLPAFPVISNPSICQIPMQSYICSLSIPHFCCCCNTHFYRSELTTPIAYSFLLLIFLDKNLLSGLITPTCILAASSPSFSHSPSAPHFLFWLPMM